MSLRVGFIECWAQNLRPRQSVTGASGFPLNRHFRPAIYPPRKRIWFPFKGARKSWRKTSRALSLHFSPVRALSQISSKSEKIGPREHPFVAKVHSLMAAHSRSTKRASKHSDARTQNTGCDPRLKATLNFPNKNLLSQDLRKKGYVVIFC